MSKYCRFKLHTDLLDLFLSEFIRDNLIFPQFLRLLVQHVAAAAARPTQGVYLGDPSKARSFAHS